jgi:hypothetical protein
MKKSLEIKFNLGQWLSHELLSILPTKEIESKSFGDEKYDKRIIAENEERIVLKKFISELKAKKEENKEVIKKAYIKSEDFPFPELILLPKFKIIESKIMNNLEKIENKDLYCSLLAHNKIPCYYNLVDRMSSDYRGRGVFMSADLSDERYLHIFRHAIAICSPHSVQSQFEYLAEEYKSLDKIDSKEKAKAKESEIKYDFHKSLRQVDPLENPHAEMIIWNMLQLTDVPHRAIKAVIDHVKELKHVTN